MCAPRTQLPENEDKRPVEYKTKTKYGNTAISGITCIEFILWALGGEQFVGNKDSLECLEKKQEDEEQTKKELVNYLGYLGHEEDVIVTEPIEVAEEVVAKNVLKEC